MLEMLDFLNQSAVLDAGLKGLWDTIRDDWLGPIFLAAVAVFAIVFIKDRSWMKLVTFIAIAAIVSLFIFNGDGIVGSNGTASGAAQDVMNSINVLLPVSK